MVLRCVIGTLLVVQATTLATQSAVTLNKSGYDGLVISIGENVPHAQCSSIIENLQTMMTEASAYLNNAMNGRAYFRSATVLFPSSWPDDCGQNVEPASGEMATRADVRISPQNLIFGDNFWTQQSQGCGKPGDFISIPYTRLIGFGKLGRTFVKEWAKLRYGVFDEAGIEGDAVYPLCYFDERDGALRISGCTDKFHNTEGLCKGTNVSSFTLEATADSMARLATAKESTSSIMYSPSSPDVTRFCNQTNHNRYAPTKHNAMCDRLSVMEVIKQHQDFQSTPKDEQPHFANTIPVLAFKREMLTRYVFVIEDTNDMQIRDSWLFLRLAFGKLANLDLSSNTEVGVVTVIGANNNTYSVLQTLPLTALNSTTREFVGNILPFSAGDVKEMHETGSACLDCGVSYAIDMLTKHGKGGGNSVIVVVAAGTDRLNELHHLGKVAKSQGIRIATVNYPQMARTTYSSLDSLAYATGAPAYTVMERRLNQDSSQLDTYFELSQALLAITNEFYQGDRSKLPVEIFRKRIQGNSQDVGTFIVPPGLGEPSKVRLYVHSLINPLVKQVTLTSPSQRVYEGISKKYLHYQILTSYAYVNESGTWTYTIDRHPGISQPLFMVVSATPTSSDQSMAPVVARFFTSSLELNDESDPLILYAEVKQGEWPVLNANVRVTVTKLGNESNSSFEERITLLDTGSGDPDITQNDGIYSRYFTGHKKGGPGSYRFEMFVDGHHSITWDPNSSYQNRRAIESNEKKQRTSSRCCGSTIWPAANHNLTPFQRSLPPVEIQVSRGAVDRVSHIPPSRIGNLKVMNSPAREPSLVWTAPGANGDVGTAERYELRYAFNLVNIMDNFEDCYKWPLGVDIPLEAGTETIFKLDFNQVSELLGLPIYVAIRGINDLNVPGKVSNVVRLLEFAEPTPASKPAGLDNNPADPKVVPNLSNGGGMITQSTQLIIASVICLLIVIVVFWVCCALIKQRRKKNSKEALPPALSSGNQQPYSGPPPVYQAEDDYNKQRDKGIYGSTMPDHLQIHLQPQQVHNNQLQSHHQQQQPQNNQQIVNARTLSPYQSWSASQLLVAHEQRQSPYGYIQQDGPPVPPPPHDQSIYTVNYFNNSFMSIADEGQSIYGQRPKQGPPTLPKPNYNPSLQGSLSSVNSADKKKRNVTMV